MRTLISALLLSGLLATAAACAANPGGYRDNGDRTCYDCGTVSTIQPRVVEGQPSAKGTILGAVVGAVVGHQFGSGHGQDAATAAGAVGGAMAGREIEKRGTDTIYDVNIRMETGSSRVIIVSSLGSLRQGDRVRVVSGNRIEII